MILPDPLSFDWDRGNLVKNYQKHQVSNQESEEIFFDPNKVIFKDKLHSGKETRHLIIGKTQKSRLLFTVFTIRNNKIRIISVRDLNKKEYYLYDKKS